MFPLVAPAVWLAPMEQVTDRVFRALCRARGADVCFTEFVNAGALVADEDSARRKLALDTADAPTAIQIYGADADTLAQAARIAASAGPAFVDLNCGCWTPRVVVKGAGAAWLREPAAMVAMARLVVQSCPLPVTVKTRIGLGTEAQMPIVDLARRLEDTGIAALTIHCRTARAGHEGAADWSWAARAQAVVRIPVVVNGDVRSASDAARALSQTGCAGVMIGRRAMEHPWVFAEVRARLGGNSPPPKITRDDRLDLVREHLALVTEHHGERTAVRTVKRFVAGYVRAVADGGAWVERLQACGSVAAMNSVLDEWRVDTAEPAGLHRETRRVRHDRWRDSSDEMD